MFAVTRCILLMLVSLSIVSTNSHYISSKKRTTTITITLPSGYVHYPNINSALRVHRERKRWTEAKEACIKEGGRLAIIDTVEKLGYVKENKPRFSNVWVGFSKENNDWVTADNHSPRSYLPWERNAPDSIGSCAIVNVKGDGLSNKICLWRKPFVCEILPTSTVDHIPNTS